jgi:hypothetical protein
MLQQGMQYAATLLPPREKKSADWYDENAHILDPLRVKRNLALKMWMTNGKKASTAISKHAKKAAVRKMKRACLFCFNQHLQMAFKTINNEIKGTWTKRAWHEVKRTPA